MAKNYFAFADYGTFDIDVVNDDLATVGLNGHFRVTDNLDFVGRTGYLSLDISVPGFSDSQDG